MPDLSVGSPFARVGDLELGLRPYHPPTPLYKYMERKWAEMVVHSGYIQLTPIASYRDLAEPGERRDDSDGLQRATVLDSDLPIEHPSEFSAWETYDPDCIANPTTGQIMAGNRWEGGGADCCLVLCLTPLLDFQLMKKFDQNNDCALQIDNPVGFFITIARHLLRIHATSSPFIGRCSYDGRPTFTEKLSGRERVMPRALMKRADHSHHAEVRMVFPTPAVPKAPLRITIPELKPYASLIDPKTVVL